ncbi:hypothetical protein NHF50_15590, partial [Flavobacterium sp. NRK F10]|uniref:hypothetical protein n=1 Tax=Flavobacterium sp. NRK F10 TaxID=2954931 RepID=UPI002090C300
AQVVIVSPTTDQSIVLSDISLGTCSSILSDSSTVTVNPTPSFGTLSSNGSICEGEDAVFDLSGTAGAVVTYTINGGSN